MSVPFTITKDNWTQIDKLEELRLAYSERNAVRESTIIYTPERSYFRKFVWNPDAEWWGKNEQDEWELMTGSRYEWQYGDGTDADKLQNNLPDFEEDGSEGMFNLQCAEFFHEIQDDLFDRGDSYFSPPVRSYFDGYGHMDNPDYGDSEYDGFYAACGGTLHASEDDEGFRRYNAVDDSGNLILLNETYARGMAEAGDILGYWIVEDLVLAFQTAVSVHKDSGLRAFVFPDSQTRSSITTDAVPEGEDPREVAGWFDHEVEVVPQPPPSTFDEHHVKQTFQELWDQAFENIDTDGSEGTLASNWNRGYTYRVEKRAWCRFYLPAGGYYYSQNDLHYLVWATDLVRSDVQVPSLVAQLVTSIDMYFYDATFDEEMNMTMPAKGGYNKLAAYQCADGSSVNIGNVGAPTNLGNEHPDDGLVDAKEFFGTSFGDSFTPPPIPPIWYGDEKEKKSLTYMARCSYSSSVFHCNFTNA